MGASDLLRALLERQDSAETQALALSFPFGWFSPGRVWLQELGMVFGPAVAYLLPGYGFTLTKGFLSEGRASALVVTCWAPLEVSG